MAPSIFKGRSPPNSAGTHGVQPLRAAQGDPSGRPVRSRSLGTCALSSYSPLKPYG